LAESNRLYDLFLALFDTDAELRRFLVVQGLPVAELLQP